MHFALIWLLVLPQDHLMQEVGVGDCGVTELRIERKPPQRTELRRHVDAGQFGRRRRGGHFLSSSVNGCILALDQLNLFIQPQC
jgi:hypothetical protein